MYICFKPKSLWNFLIPDMYLNREVLITLGKTKYLRVFIDCDVHDNDDIMCQVQAIYAKGNILINRFKFCNDDLKSCLFQSYI